MTNPISGVNVIVAVGSVDGMAGAAACKRHAGDDSIQVIFTQAFEVNAICVSEWPLGSKVGFVDLGVNIKNMQMTVDFVKRIYNAGHTILFIADEHGKKQWHDVLDWCGLDKKQLTIRPKDRSVKYTSSCAILFKAFGEAADMHTTELLYGGDQADQLNVDTYFGSVFTRAVKSNRYDRTRRPYLVNHLARNKSLDAKIQGWIAEYAVMEKNLPRILATKWPLCDNFMCYNATGLRHDATAVFEAAYKISSTVMLSCRGGVSVGTKDDRLNLLEILQKANVEASGMASKVNFSHEWACQALRAICGVLVRSQR